VRCHQKPDDTNDVDDYANQVVTDEIRTIPSPGGVLKGVSSCLVNLADETGSGRESSLIRESQSITSTSVAASASRRLVVPRRK
jgi:hypothetical protein